MSESVTTPWSRGEAEKAGIALFGNSALHRAAAAMAGCHPHALDYIRQAPVIVLSANAGMTGRRAAASAQRFAGPPMRMLAEKGAKLRDVMSFYGCGFHLRKLAPSVLHPKRWRVIYHLGRLPPSTLSQIVPEVRRQQDVWLRALTVWSDHCERRCGNPWLLFDWAATALRVVARGQEDGVEHVADLAIEAARSQPRGGALFDPRWSYPNAQAAAQRWHGTLSRAKAEREAAFGLGVGFEMSVAYAPFPDEAVSVLGYEFVPLRSCEALWQEGAAMHHCVATYSRSVIHGTSRIFSVRCDGRRIATAEYARPLRDDDAALRFSLVQLKGPCNTRPDAAVAKAAAAFLTHVREGEKRPDTLRGAFPDVSARFTGERAA